jgi:hypothetical protein
MKIVKQGNLSDVILAQADYLERFADDRHTIALPGEEPFWIEGRENVLKLAKGLRAMALERRKVELSQWN